MLNMDPVCCHCCCCSTSATQKMVANICAGKPNFSFQMRKKTFIPEPKPWKSLQNEGRESECVCETEQWLYSGDSKSLWPYKFIYILLDSLSGRFNIVIYQNYRVRCACSFAVGQLFMIYWSPSKFSAEQ